MTEVADVKVKGTADVSEAKKGIEDLGDTATKSGGFFKNAASSLIGFVAGMGIIGTATAAFGFLSDTIKESVDAASEDQMVQAQLGAALKSTHDSVGLTAGQLTDLAEKLSLTTTFSKDTTLQAEEMGLRFQNIGKAIFPQVVETAQDLSSRLGVGLTQAMTLVGKAVDNPTKGLTALTRVGVTFTAQQTEQIKQMVASGNTMGAQGIILDALKEKFGGAAEAAGSTFAGRLQILQNSFEELKVKIGDAVIPILTQLLTDATPLLNLFGSLLPPVLGKVSTLLAGLSPVISSVFSVITPVITGFVNTLLGVSSGTTLTGSHLGTLMSSFQSLAGPVSNVASAFNSQVVPAFKAMIPQLETTGRTILSELAPAFQSIVGVVRDVLPAVFNVLIAILKNLFPLISTIANIVSTQLIPALAQIIPVIGPIIDQLGKWIAQLLNVLVPLLQVVLPVAIGILVLAFKLVLAIVQAVWPVIQTVIQTAINIISDIIKTFSDLLKGNWGALWNDLKQLVGDIIGGIINIVVAWVGALLGIFGGILGHILPILGDLGGGILGAFGNLFDAVIGAVSSFGNKLGSAAGQWLKGIAQSVLNGIGTVINAFEQLGNSILGVVRNIGSQVSGALNSIPGIGGIIGHIPGFAMGTTSAPGGLAMVGEGQEPELVVGPHFGILGAGTGVYPISQLGVQGGYGGGFGQQLIVIQLDSQVLTRSTIKGTPKQVWMMTGTRGTH